MTNEYLRIQSLKVSSAATDRTDAATLEQRGINVLIRGDQLDPQAAAQSKSSRCGAKNRNRPRYHIGALIKPCPVITVYKCRSFCRWQQMLFTVNNDAMRR